MVVPLANGITLEKSEIERVLHHLYAEAKRKIPGAGDRTKQKGHCPRRSNLLVASLI